MIDEFSYLREIMPAIAIKLGVALLCGVLLGMERESKEKPAGLRTLTLITVGSALFMIVSDLLIIVTDELNVTTSADPSRIASQVVTGIGFLGAGAIIQSYGSIRGLTTAADIWVAAGIGLCVGVGFPVLGIGITLLVLLVLVVLDPIGTWLGRGGDAHEVELVFPNDSLTLIRVRNVLSSNDACEGDIRVNPSGDSIIMGVTYEARRRGKHTLLEELAAIEGVRGAEWKSQSSGQEGA